jgi:hypothetical protein
MKVIYISSIAVISCVLAGNAFSSNLSMPGRRLASPEKRIENIGKTSNNTLCGLHVDLVTGANDYARSKGANNVAVQDLADGATRVVVCTVGDGTVVIGFYPGRPTEAIVF